MILGVPLLWWGTRSSSFFALGLVSVLGASVPAWSMIIAAVGADSTRKLQYGLGLLAFALLFDLAAYGTGWQQMVSSASVVQGAGIGMLIGAYQLILVGAPVVALVLFAGRRPGVFWMRR